MGKRDLIVISSYPDRGGVHSAKTVGVASYAKLLLQSLARVTKDRISVFAEELGKREEYSENEVMVNRSWQRGNFLSLIKLFYQVLIRSEKVVIVSFEINMFGGYVHVVVAILGMLCLKLSGKKILLILHQAPDDLSEIEGNELKLLLSNIALKLLYVALRSASSKIIVFEDYLRQIVGGRNVDFIPHLIPSIKVSPTKVESKVKLGWDKNKKFALVFGYIAPYKGIKELLSAWTNEIGYQLIIAGGINPNHKNNQKILEYYAEVEKIAKEKNVEITGFVDESMMPYYFAGCDVVILPYKKMFSSSGPLALAWSFHKPILMSNALSGYLHSKDVRETMDIASIKDVDVFVKINSQSLSVALKKLSENKIDKYTKWGQLMCKKREIEFVAEIYKKEVVKLQENL